MKYLVIGGAGFVGGVFHRVALSQGHKCLIYDDLSIGHRDSVHSKAQLVVGDIRETKKLRNLIADFEPDAIFHFAALAIVADSMSNSMEYYDNIVTGTMSILKASIDHAKVPDIIFSSTCALYGQAKHLPLKETDPKSPTSPYGRAKLCAEYMIEDFSLNYGIRSMALRYFNACGAMPKGEFGENHEPETHLIPNAIKAAVDGTPLTVFGYNLPTPDGTCIRDYIHVLDLAEAHLLSAGHLIDKQKASFSALNLGSGVGHSILGIVKIVEKVTGRKIQLDFREPRPGDPDQLYADVSEALHVLRFKVRHSDMTHIVKTAYEWHMCRLGLPAISPEARVLAEREEGILPPSSETPWVSRVIPAS